MWKSSTSSAAVAVETLCIYFIAKRASHSRNPYIRAQIYVLPFLISLTATELLLALLWKDEDLNPIDSPIGTTCSDYNRLLTKIYWFGIFPFQPLLMILPCGGRWSGVGSPNNRDYTRAAEVIGGILVFFHLFFYLRQHTWKRSWQKEMMPLRAIHRYDFTTFSNGVTCTYLGPHKLLYMTYASNQSWVTPNIFGWLYPLISLFFCQPKKFAAGCFIGLALLYIVIIIYLDISVEAIAAWTWLGGILAHLYFVSQPYLWPFDAGDMALLKEKPKLE